MEFQQIINERRSIRHYDANRKISEAEIKELIEAAVLAPSWKNFQTTRYYCVIDEKKLETFRNSCLPEFNAKNTEGAPALIVTTFVKNRAGYEKNGEPNNEVGNGWGFYDAGLQNENLVLKAKDLGMDTLIMGIRDCEAIRELLDIPEEELVISVISVGYRTKDATMPPRKSADELVKFI